MFNAKTEVNRLQRLQSTRRKRRYAGSKLDPYKYELLLLHGLGVSLSQLQRFLMERKIKAARSTIHYWLKKHG